MKKLYLLLGITLLIITSIFINEKGLLKGSIKFQKNNNSIQTQERIHDNSENTNIHIHPAEDFKLLPYPLKPEDIDKVIKKYGPDTFLKNRIGKETIRQNYKSPNYSKEKRIYKAAFVYITFVNMDSNTSFSSEQIKSIDQIRKSLPIFFEIATQNLATVDTSYPVTEIASYDENDYTVDTLTKDFYKDNPDEFDFIFFYIPGIKNSSSYQPVKADYSGGCITTQCTKCFDDSNSYGSNSKLKGIIQMKRQTDNFPVDPFNKKNTYSPSYNDYLKNLVKIFPEKMKPWEDLFGATYFEHIVAIHELEHAWSLYLIIGEVAGGGKNTYNAEDFSPSQKKILKKFENIQRGFGNSSGPHFGTLVENQTSADPHDAIKFEIEPDNRIKICLNKIPPTQPYKYNPLTLYFMGFQDKIDMSYKYKYLNQYLKYENPQNQSNEIIKNIKKLSGPGTNDLMAGLNLDDYKNGCFYYKITVDKSYYGIDEKDLESYSQFLKPVFEGFTIKEVDDIWGEIYQCK